MHLVWLGTSAAQSHSQFVRPPGQPAAAPFPSPIDPTFASVKAIADGNYDDYLKSYAASVRKYGHAVVIGFGHEMNAPWYPWGSACARHYLRSGLAAHRVSVPGSGCVTTSPGCGP